ncbi:MAG: pilus assembly PilX N-terminal domain-containing protein [Fibrobacter sp.]|nr:pilus assembly PilX N-terminal domain-containing protein [Fibrobacter sp.]
MKFGISSKKAGVSLVTVLLFMLVATIAATATYKWLTSEGRSSGSRMQKQMAYQSAVAGIENARAWMTFHANDVGALVKQYMDGNYVPINLDANLRSLQRPGQNHHVWLVGVNTSGSTYKLKVLSSGEANGGAKHSEIAIFNVSGLYQVSLPVPQTAKKKIPFDYAYFGGSYDGAGSLTMTSAIVNGNWYGNPQGIEKKFVVTGNAELTGNNVSIGELACVGGNMSPENNGLMGKDLYVGKNFTGNINASGNAYFEGNVSPSSAGPFEIGGHVTLNGDLQTVQSAKPMTIKGDLCLAEDAHIISRGTNYVFKSEGNVWMPGTQNLWYGSVKYSGCSCERVWCSWMGCQPKTVVSCTGSSKKQEPNGWYGWGEATYTLLNCADTNLVSDGDHYDKYETIILGGAGKTVYMKSGYPWSSYNSLVENKFTETTDEIIKCNVKPGVMAPDMNHAYCDNGHEGKVGPAERWNGAQYSPYPEKASKEKLYYSYYLEPGHDDVTLTSITDPYWIWCNKWEHNTFGWQYCSDATEGVEMLAYHVDGQRFWDGFENHDRKRLNYKDGKPTGSPYCTNQNGGPGHERDKFRPICGVTPWFMSNGTVTRDEPSTKLECAKAVKDSCNEIWEKKPGCDGSSYKVDDVLVTAKTMFEPYASKGCAANITRYSNDLVTKLNACYQENTTDATKREKNLYNGYLVVKVSGGTNSTNPSGTLEGKFIIIAKDALYTKLPQTSGDTRVLLYLEKGANTLNDVTVSNYFIYTEGNIGSGNQFNLTGTIYATAESCAGLGKLQSSSITYNQELVNALSEAGVICPNDGSVCGGTGGTGSGGGDPSGSGSGESTEESTATNGTDAYYISMAPQLGVTLESQYENNETLPSGNNQANLNPSFIVLPRVIYLPGDPFGELNDYYNVVPLNGSTLKKADVSVGSCVGGSGSLSTTGKLYSGVALAKGIYTCNAKANGYSDVPFWVVVGDNHRGSLPITFVDPDQKISAGMTKDVNVVIPPNTPATTLYTTCPSADEHWSYTLGASGTRSDESSTCSFPIQGDPSTSKIVTLFSVTTDASATHGSITFQLLSGDGYHIGSPYTATVYMASSATLKRVDVTDNDIAKYCESHSSVCPPEGQRGDASWPSCSVDETWVEPSGITFGTEERNNRWNIVVGGSGTLQLAGRNVENCVVIIPTEGNSYDISEIAVDSEKELRASIKALKKTIRLTFVGEISGYDPVISINVGNTSSECKYSTSGDDKSCYVSAFSGQTVSLTVSRTSYPKFNYWSCSGVSCPVTEAISSETYREFTIKDDNSVIYAHFNESDKHCFFEEFKSGDVRCTSVDMEYCIDKCGNADDATCVGAIDATGEYTKSKWHLISGKMSDIDEVAGSVSLRRQGRVTVHPVTVMSTVNAGTYGTMKALFQLPKETASHNRNTQEISKSGFLLHSNVSGSEYLMLNVFAGQTGYLTAQLCSNSGKCLNGVLVDDNDNPALVYASSMVMMSATISVDGKLSLAAFTGNYYGTPTEYGFVFDLNDFGTSYMDVAHEFVGFSLADPNFKLYGIGWKSDTYSAECHDYYPTVKCSFAAVATNGVIPTATTEDAHYIKPWIGHSGWYDSKTYNCTEKYYYYNGDDACGGASGATPVECTTSGYSFAETGAGQHGYKDAGQNDVKTAKAWLECSLNSEEIEWTKEMKNERAHCGPFWTGKINKCADHVAIDDAKDKPLSAGQETTVTLTNPANLRETSLSIELAEANGDPASGVDVEIWLMSENALWGAQGYASKSVVMTTGKASFSVDDAMTVGAEGFDPEHVKQIIFKNRGSSALLVKSVVASCKNAVDISECTANYADGKWTVLVGVQNKDNIASYGVEAKVDNATVFNISRLPADVTWNDQKAQIEQADNPYAEYQGKSYKFFASIVNNTGSTASKECSVTPSTIGSINRSCGVTGSPKKQGEGMPQFNINLDGCPTGGCQYEVYIGDAMLDGYPKNGSGSINVTPNGNGKNGDGSAPTSASSAAADYVVGTYKYKVKSPEGASYPFSDCEASFEITEKSSGNENDVRTECYLDNSGSISQPGANASFHFSVHEKGIDICDHQYKLMLGTTVLSQGSTGCNSEKNIQFSGINTAKSGTVVLQVQDPEDDVYKESCTANLTVGSPGVTCSKIVESSVDKFKIAVSNPCANDACPWKLVKGNDTQNPVSSSSNLGSSEYKIPFTGIGNYTLYVNDEAVSGCTISQGPDVTCPSKRTFTKNKQVQFTMADLVNCGGGCDYDFNISTTNTVDASVDDGSYTSKNTAISFTTPNTEDDDVDYTFTVYSHSDHTFSDNCTGKMEFVAGSTCKQATWTPNAGQNPDNTGSGGGSWSSALPWKSDCFSLEVTDRVCSGYQIKAEDCKSETLTLNGNSITLGSGDGYASGTIATPKNPIEIKANKECTISQIYFDNCKNYTPVISCSALNGEKNINSSVQIAPTVTNCTNDVKCSYTIVGGTTDINHSEKNWTSTSAMDELDVVSSERSVTYTLQVSNAFNTSSACVFTISYVDPNKSQEVGKQESFNVNTTGKKVKIKGSETPSGGCQLACSVSGNPGNVSVSLNGTTVVSGNNYAGGNISTSYCRGGSEWTVRASHSAVTSCNFNWW